ncbi:cytochrome c biogenesis protein [Corynebacterium kutscheri]|uniref:cytochrome c biogenesis CcdA family protein n=1 Tax=Corynebacterium kutscheri TaxID=35755 RepID=UPI000F6FBD40|nr:cytochrome c biogenesis protein CcdA [Corynebacterium kutscheri]VEH80790.1 cytochrome c biogenesis protein [Corynebacterium kutscheri]
MLSVGLIGAFAAGVLTLISPCSALLVPAFFAYAFSSIKELTAKTFVFFLGLCLTLVPIGTGLATWLASNRDQAILIGGWLIIILGIISFFGGGFRIPFLANLSSRVRGQGVIPVFFLGAVYGFAGFCAGPLLGAVLTTAAVSGSTAYGALIMTAYAAGMALPLFLLALLWDRFELGQKSWLRGKEIQLGPLRTNTLSMAAGVIFVLIGWLFITSYGSASLPTLLNTDTQFSIQSWAQNKLGAVSDRWALFTASLFATILVGIKASRTKVPQA